MNNKLITITLIISMLFISCATHLHTVGHGPQSGVRQVSRQYYIIFGLVPINTVDTIQLAGIDMNGNPIENYEITTQYTVVDFAIQMGLTIITAPIGGLGGLLSSRTVTVTK
jgi:hypothetical protein